MQAPKNGFFYVLDREERPADQRAAVLPMSATTVHRDQLGHARRQGRQAGRSRTPQARFIARAAVTRCARPNGAHTWHPMSFSPQTGLVYLPAQEMAFPYVHDANPVTREGFNNVGVVFDRLPDDTAVRAAIKAASTGVLLAWDPVAQREVWRSDRRGPVNGGTLATAGGLVFQGTGDGQFLALDARTGKTLWSTTIRPRRLPVRSATKSAASSTSRCIAGYGGAFFLIEGFIAASEGHALNGRVYVFKLGGTAPRPTLNLQKAPIAKPPDHRGQHRRLQSRRSALRRQLHLLPWRCGCDRRRAAGSPAITASAGRRRLASSGGGWGPGAVGNATFWKIRVCGGGRIDSRLRRPAGCDALHGRGRPAPTVRDGITFSRSRTMSTNRPV